MRVSLRDSTSEDFEFVFNLNKTNMHKYVEATRAWDDETEHKDMKGKFTPGIDKIIQAEGKDIGVFRVIEENRGLTIDHIELLPQFQNKGIGSRLIKDLITQNLDKDIALKVLKENPAKELYKKLGFSVVGEDKRKYCMNLPARISEQ